MRNAHGEYGGGATRRTRALCVAACVATSTASEPTPFGFQRFARGVIFQEGDDTRERANERDRLAFDVDVDAITGFVTLRRRIDGEKTTLEKTTLSCRASRAFGGYRGRFAEGPSSSDDGGDEEPSANAPPLRRSKGCPFDRVVVAIDRRR